MQASEGEAGPSANGFVAVQGELSKSVLCRREDNAGEGIPEVAPAGGEPEWIWGAVEEHGQVEVPQGCENGLEWGRFEAGKVPSAQIVKGEGRQLRWRTDAEAVHESTENVCLEGESALVVVADPVIID